MKRTISIFTQLILLLIAASTWLGHAQESTSAEQLALGKKVYLNNCAGCHKKDLSGAIGFNLKDGDWQHGSTPEQILNSINNGFASKGMPGFEYILPSEQRKAVVDYILSKREGFEGLTYKLYQLNSDTDTELTPAKLIKQGSLKHNLMDFEIPEVPHYALHFSGTFYTHKDQNTFLFAEAIRNVKIDVLVDGTVVKPVTYSNVQKWRLNKGKQQVSFTYFSGKAKAYLRNVALYVVNHNNTIKLFPVSTKALANSKKASYEVKSVGQYVVQQKKIVNLPPRSMAVGSPDKINFAFNTKNCAINGLWTGDLLNIGPNIAGRGKDGSVALGKWQFHHPAQIQVKTNTASECRFIKYRLDDGAPELFFNIGETQLKMTPKTRSSRQIEFNYQVLSQPANSNIKISLPTGSGFSISSKQGVISNNLLSIDMAKQPNFTISVNLEQ